jgi:Cys-rich protein (TIGR01571 family)
MAAPAPAANQGPINDKDMEHWKSRINEVLAKPSEHVNSKSPETAQPFHNGFFSCLSPIDLCLFTYCLPCVTFGKTHHRLHKSANLEGYEPINTTCLLFCASGCFGLHWIPMSMQRAEIREKYNLAGSCIVDIATACCCALCDLTQAEKEVEYRAPLLAQGGVKEQYQTNNSMTYPGQ